MPTILCGYHTAVYVVAAKGVHGDDARKDLDQHIRNFRRVILVDGRCEDPGNSQVGMLLNELHGRNLGPKFGVAFSKRRGGLDADPSCPATPIRELEQANKVVEPACDLIQSNAFQMTVCIRGNEA
jgi:hypothetical protein